MTRITNTRDQDPLLNLMAAMVPGGIEDQEARGQQELCNSQELPLEGSEDPRWAMIGVTFGEQVDGDPLFRSVTLPPGWKIVATEHSMWSDLQDEKGRRRAGIFYKAAHYDRKAHVRLEERFSYGRDYMLEKELVFRIKDGETEIYRSEVVPCPLEQHGQWLASTPRQRLEEEWKPRLEAWLDKHRAGWRDYKTSWELT